MGTSTTAPFPRADEKWLHALAAFAFLCASSPLLAQGLDGEDPTDVIVGSEVTTEETLARIDADRIVAAIEDSQQNAEKVRKTFNLEEIGIVFVPDIGEGESAVAEAVATHEAEIGSLHEAIESSALFYHGVDSRSIMVRDIIAVEYRTAKVTIFVSGLASGQ